ncbi:uncharacterized protein G2W53_000289 [Senna tora]|uniref:Uncharacterized protein n=1 Tax=Senna tora TaxID=362788 RepID=A0A834XDN5_9FABA|nr:uncharacterized protein G2W53_000289 [Senna tora]
MEKLIEEKVGLKIDERDDDHN